VLLGPRKALEVFEQMPAVLALAAKQGIDGKQAWADYISAVSRGNPELLDNLGIVIKSDDAYASYAATLGKSASDLTGAERSQAFLAAAMEATERAAAGLTPVEETMAGAQRAIITEFENTKNAVGQSLVPALNEVLKAILPLIQEYLPQLVDWFTTKVVPAIEAAAKWFGENLPGAIEAVQGWFGKLQVGVGGLVSYWQTSLKPALEGVYNWFKQYIWPAIDAVASLIGALYGFYLRNLWAFLTHYIFPALSALWGWLKEKLGPVFDAWKRAVEDVMTVLGPFWQALKDIAGLLNSFPAIPDLLKGHSPSPLEKSIRGVTAAMLELKQASLPSLGGRVSLGVAGQVSGRTMSAPMGAGGGLGGMTLAPSYILNMHSSAPREPIVADFRMMQALSRRG